MINYEGALEMSSPLMRGIDAAVEKFTVNLSGSIQTE
jgi:hypothetical protein